MPKIGPKTAFFGTFSAVDAERVIGSAIRKLFWKAEAVLFRRYFIVIQDWTTPSWCKMHLGTDGNFDG